MLISVRIGHLRDGCSGARRDCSNADCRKLDTKGSGVDHLVSMIGSEYAMASYRAPSDMRFLCQRKSDDDRLCHAWFDYNPVGWARWSIRRRRRYQRYHLGLGLRRKYASTCLASSSRRISTGSLYHRFRLLELGPESLLLQQYRHRYLPTRQFVSDGRSIRFFTPLRHDKLSGMDLPAPSLTIGPSARIPIYPTSLRPGYRNHLDHCFPE